MFLFTVHLCTLYTLNRITDNCCWVCAQLYTPVVVRCSLELSAVSNPVSVSQLFANQFDCDLTLSLSSSVIADLELQ